MAGWRTFSTFTASAMTGMSSILPTWRSPWAPLRSCMTCCSRRFPMGIPAMRFEMRVLATLLTMSLAIAALSGCEDLRRAAGLNKKSPDEFAVTTKAPLVIPPDFNLRPPMPGAPPANTLDPSSNAELALFSNTDPQTVAAGMRGNYTPGEKMLLANAKAQLSDPGIRARLNADQRAAVQNADRSFTDKLLMTAATPDTGKPVNADAEVNKGRKTTTKTKKDSGGWFDWF